MDTLKPKNSKSITFIVRGGFLTFWAILAYSAALLAHFHLCVFVLCAKDYKKFLPDTRIGQNVFSEQCHCLVNMVDLWPEVDTEVARPFSPINPSIVDHAVFFKSELIQNIYLP